MYTVVRFTTDHDHLVSVTDIGQRLNAVRPGSFRGIRKAGDGFSFDLCDRDQWVHHHEAIISFVTVVGEIIREAVSLHIAVTADVAIEPEVFMDGKKLATLRLDEDLLRKLFESKLAIAVRRY
jgi:hypothetical protein